MPLRNSDKLPDLTLFHPANSEATTIRDWILREGRQKRTRWAGHSLIAVVHWGRVRLLGPDQHVPVWLSYAFGQNPAVRARVLPALHRNFNFTGGHAKRHPQLSSNGEAFADGISHIGFGFSLSLGTPLAYATRDGRALSGVDAIFVLVNRNCELHLSIITLRNRPGR